MSLASLAAYASSDESDSDQDESPSTLEDNESTVTAGTSDSSAPSAPPAPPVATGVDLIEDEDDHLLAHSSVTSSLPQADNREDSVAGSLFQANDVVDDVPLATKIQAEKPPKKSQKVKISVPSLSQVCVWI